MRTPETSPRLGRGLAALFGDATPSGAMETLRRTSLPLTALEPGPFQPRTSMDRDALDELVASIRQQGVLQPILARPHPAMEGRYQIVAGERRWRAAQAAGLHDMPVLIRRLSDTEAMAASLVENLQRQDLNAIEEAEGYRRLIQEFGLTQDKLGDAIGKSRSHVANSVRLLQLPNSVRERVQDGTLSAGHARALLTHPEPENAARAVIAQGLNVRQTEALANRTVRSVDRTRHAIDRGVALEAEAVARELSDQVGLRVEVSHSGRGGTVRIHYQTLEQLDGLIVRLSRSR